MPNKRKQEHKPTAKGYIRLRRDKKAKMEHVLIWEQQHGPIPEGMQIHHIDGNKKNNNISNLQLVSVIEHKRIHEGCKYIDGEWYKPCAKCGEYKKCDHENWYFSRGYINGKLCKKCFIEKIVRNKEIREQVGRKRKEYPKKSACVQPDY